MRKKKTDRQTDRQTDVSKNRTLATAIDVDNDNDDNYDNDVCTDNSHTSTKIEQELIRR